MRTLCWLVLAMLLPGTASAAEDRWPMSYLKTYGPAADPATQLTWGLLVISILVCVIIAFLVLLATFRKRSPPQLDEQGRLPVQPARGGMNWIYIGVALSAIVLFGCAIWTVMTLSAVTAPRASSALNVEVIGHQWWWEVRYLSDNPQEVFTTANEIHIPVGAPVHLKLESPDVIHSFWVPQLAGKTDVIPGQTNYAWLQADRPGDYRGQCAEFCGVQHAHMALHVIADEPARFEAWRRNQLTDAQPSADQQVLHGSQVFTENCSVCHAVRGTSAGGNLGPDLTHLMSRSTIASGTLPNNVAGLSGWIADAQSIKPGARMPAMYLSPDDLHAVVAYLQTLH